MRAAQLFASRMRSVVRPSAEAQPSSWSSPRSAGPGSGLRAVSRIRAAEPDGSDEGIHACGLGVEQPARRVFERRSSLRPSARRSARRGRFERTGRRFRQPSRGNRRLIPSPEAILGMDEAALSSRPARWRRRFRIAVASRRTSRSRSGRTRIAPFLGKDWDVAVARFQCRSSPRNPKRRQIAGRM